MLTYLAVTAAMLRAEFLISITSLRKKRVRIHLNEGVHEGVNGGKGEERSGARGKQYA